MIGPLNEQLLRFSCCCFYGRVFPCKVAVVPMEFQQFGWWVKPTLLGWWFIITVIPPEVILISCEITTITLFNRLLNPAYSTKTYEVSSNLPVTIYTIIPRIITNKTSTSKKNCAMKRNGYDLYEPTSITESPRPSCITERTLWYSLAGLSKWNSACASCASPFVTTVGIPKKWFKDERCENCWTRSNPYFRKVEWWFADVWWTKKRVKRTNSLLMRYPSPPTNVVNRVNSESKKQHINTGWDGCGNLFTNTHLCLSLSLSLNISIYYICIYCTYRC